MASKPENINLAFIHIVWSPGKLTASTLQDYNTQVNKTRPQLTIGTKTMFSADLLIGLIALWYKQFHLWVNSCMIRNTISNILKKFSEVLKFVTIPFPAIKYNIKINKMLRWLHQ